MDNGYIDRRQFLAFAGMVLAGSGAGLAAPSQESTKRVIFTTQFATNYCTHLFAAAGINWQSAFPARPCLTQKQYELLSGHSELLAFGQGRSGPFTSFMYFLPALLDVTDFGEYYATLIEALETNTFGDFAAHHRLNMGDIFISRQFDYFCHLSSSDWETVVAPLLPQFKQIGSVFVDCAECYRGLWELEVEPVLADTANQLNEYMCKYQYIPAWEQLTGRTFAAESYTIILCHENKNGPDANSVAYDRNIFLYDAPPQRFRDFVSHEIGTHLLIDLFETGNNASDQRYAAVECLAYFLNRKILGSYDLQYSLHGLQPDMYLPLYDKFYEPGKPYDQLVNEVLAAAGT